MKSSRKKSPLNNLILSVVLIHFGLILWGIKSSSIPQQKTFHKIAVKTYTPAPKPSQAAVQTKTTPKPKPKVKKAPVKKTSSKNTKKNKPSPQHSASTIKKETLNKQKHLKDLEERIAKIEEKHAKMPQTNQTKMASNPKNTPISNSLGVDSINAIVGYLERCLDLPEMGEVQIQITLNRNGQVEAMKVIKASSEKNKEYLEKELPKLRFTHLTNLSSSQSFLFTFCNK